MGKVEITEEEWQEAFELFSCWCTGHEVANALGVCYSTFKKKLKEEKGLTIQEAKKRFRHKGSAVIKKAQFELVRQLHPSAVIFLSKALLGYRDNESASESVPSITIHTADGKIYDFGKFKKQEESNNDEDDDE